jgi:hypothetical protein
MKHRIVNIILFVALFCFYQSNAQQLFYKMPDGNIQDGTYFKVIE